MKTNRITTKLPHEVFQLLEDTTKAADRVKILQDNESFGLKTVLQGAFHPGIVFDLPEGTPPFTPDPGPPGLQPVPFGKAVTALARCVIDKNSANKIIRFKKEKTFIGLLESVHPKDAEILIAVKDKKLHKLYALVTANLVRKAFPNLIP